MTNAPMRAFLGFVIAAISVLIFHQGMIFILGQLGLIRATVYGLNAVGPLGVPAIVNQMFWAGLYGVAFGLVWPRLTLPAWVCGLILGIIASLVGMFVVAPIKGAPAGAGLQAWPMARHLLIHASWGLGVGLFALLLLPRRVER